MDHLQSLQILEPGPGGSRTFCWVAVIELKRESPKKQGPKIGPKILELLLNRDPRNGPLQFVETPK